MQADSDYEALLRTPPTTGMADVGKIVIHGVTEQGSIFRPSDWAERLSGQLCKIVNKRLCYSPMLRPGVRDDIKCLLLCPSLQAHDPQLFRLVLDFARKNQLKVSLSDKL